MLACAREAEDEICPTVAEGDLVVTEIRGAQSGGNETYGQWIELLNTTGDDIDLRGLRVLLYRLDGSGDARLIVRTEDVSLNAGEYLVLGHHGPRDSDIPEFVDYSFFGDYHGENDSGPITSDLYDTGVIEVYACGELIDRVIYRDLPDLGSWALDGNVEPTSKANDDEFAWCVDDEEPPPEGPQLFIGVPGTPGEANRPCE